MPDLYQLGQHLAQPAPASGQPELEVGQRQGRSLRRSNRDGPFGLQQQLDRAAECSPL